MIHAFVAAALLVGQTLAAPSNKSSRCRHEAQESVAVEQKSLEELYQDAQKEFEKEKVPIVLWHGGDEKNQQDTVKNEFNEKYPKAGGLEVTVDLSKYLNAKVDEMFRNKKKITVDSVMLQTVHDYPRWANDSILLPYKPLGFDKIYPDLKDPSGMYYGIEIFSWSNMANTKKLGETPPPQDFKDFLDPKFKNKLVLTYPNDDDAVLYAFDLIFQGKTEEEKNKWVQDLIAQNVTWVRGTATPLTLIGRDNSTAAASFTTSAGFSHMDNISSKFPRDHDFVSWAQRAAILKGSPRPAGAKLLHSFMLSQDFQKRNLGWSVRNDITSKPENQTQTDHAIMEVKNTHPAKFNKWMENREYVEQEIKWWDGKIGVVNATSPLEDDVV